MWGLASDSCCKMQVSEYQLSNIENAAEKWFRYSSWPVRILWNSSGASRLLWSEERTWKVIILWSVIWINKDSMPKSFKVFWFLETLSESVLLIQSILVFRNFVRICVTNTEYQSSAMSPNATELLSLLPQFMCYKLPLEWHELVQNHTLNQPLREFPGIITSSFPIIEGSFIMVDIFFVVHFFT